MTTAIIGVGNIGKAVARNLVKGGERVVLASRTQAHADALASELGALATATTVAQAIQDADVIVFAVYLNVLQELIATHSAALEGKIIVDPTNPIRPEGDSFVRTLPDDISAASVVLELLPSGAHYVKAFNALGADALSTGGHQMPRIALLYATDDTHAAEVVEKLGRSAGFDPVDAGGLQGALRTELFGDLHQFAGLKGKVLTGDEAREATLHSANALAFNRSES